MAAVIQQKKPRMVTEIQENGKVTKTIAQSVPEFNANMNQMKLAFAAAQAMSEGKDAVLAAKMELDAHKAQEKDFMDTKRYMIACANKDRGHFDELSIQELLDVMALTRTPEVDLENFKKNIEVK